MKYLKRKINIKYLNYYLKCDIITGFVRCAPVAQLDRVNGYEPLGRGFESLLARHVVGMDFAPFRFLFAQKSVTRCVVPPFPKKSSTFREPFFHSQSSLWFSFFVKNLMIFHECAPTALFYFKAYWFAALCLHKTRLRLSGCRSSFPKNLRFFGSPIFIESTLLQLS